MRFQDTKRAKSRNFIDLLGNQSLAPTQDDVEGCSVVFLDESLLAHDAFLQIGPATGWGLRILAMEIDFTLEYEEDQQSVDLVGYESVDRFAELGVHDTRGRLVWDLSLRPTRYLFRFQF